MEGIGGVGGGEGGKGNGGNIVLRNEIFKKYLKKISKYCIKILCYD